MNRVEIMLATAKSKLSQHPDVWHWVETYEKQVKFLEWLLEETDYMCHWEIHQPRVSPQVWGMGDVTHSISIQLKKIKTPASPVVLVFDYDTSNSTKIEEEVE